MATNSLATAAAVKQPVSNFRASPVSLGDEFHAIRLRLGRTTYDRNQFLLLSRNFLLFHLDLLPSFHHLNLHLFAANLLLLLRALQLVRKLGLRFLNIPTDAVQFSSYIYTAYLYIYIS